MTDETEVERIAKVLYEAARTTGWSLPATWSELTGVNYGWIPVFEAMARAVIADRQREQ